MRILRLCAVITCAAAAVVAVACGDDDDDKPPPTPVPDAGPRGIEQAGQTCTSPTQCYPKLDGGDAGDSGQLAVQGTIYCETKVPNGYCTHECTGDDNCCAVPGECLTAIKQVCSPFTNTDNPKYCFLSCELADIQRTIAANADAGYWDGGVIRDGGSFENDYCYWYASQYATCRSSGGGVENRKVCIPQF